jgi:Protein of unknown function (DUF2911)/Protein of unknown function (DUF3347)
LPITLVGFYTEGSLDFPQNGFCPLFFNKKKKFKMKKLLVAYIFCVFALTLSAQESAKTPLPKSPEAAFTQQFGGSEIQVAYARPLTRGRKIFGALVPFDSLWRTGASECTTIKLKEEVTMGDKKVAAGKYALFTIPTADEWTIILNEDTTLHGAIGYDAQKDKYRFKVKSIKSDRFYETFTIEINDINANGEGFLNLIWENTLVKIPLNNALAAVAADKSTPVVVVEKPVVKTETMPKPDAHAGHDMSTMKNTEGVSAPDLKTQFAPVLAAYYGVKDALVGDNGKLAATQAKALKAALSKLEPKNWTAKERIAFDNVAKKLETDAEHIGDNAAKIDHQREHFITLSTNLTVVVKALKINEEAAYLQFCPMANDGKGAYWLSKENKVKNPYYGKSMLTCGSVKETLK